MRMGIRRLEQCIKEVQDFTPAAIARKPADLTAKAATMQAAVESVLAQTFGHGTVEYGHYATAASFTWSVGLYETPVHVIVESLQESRESALGLLRQAVSFLKTEIELALPTAQPTPSAAAHPKPSNKVFVVNGHDEAALQATARFLEQLQLEAIVLREQPDEAARPSRNSRRMRAKLALRLFFSLPTTLAGRPLRQHKSREPART
jgi:hypothetical protein